jgi:ABC-type antimicrobial peptide transport system permease subunit
MGWTPEQALGKTITLWEYEGKVIGVVKDFHFRPMTTTIEPFLFYCWPRETPSGLFVRAQGGQVKEAISKIESLYKKYEHKAAVHYQFVDEALEKQYQTQQKTGRIMLYFSTLAIVVSCLGLFGLATFTAQYRTKEIGVRKVLGASMANIVNMLCGDFIKPVLIAIIIASPIAWWCMNRWLQSFAYKITIAWWFFIGTGILALLIAWITVWVQALKAAAANPTDCLKND